MEIFGWIVIFICIWFFGFLAGVTFHKGVIRESKKIDEGLKLVSRGPNDV